MSNLRTLIIPPVHERLDMLDACESLIDRAERVVVMGNLFDTLDTHNFVAGMCTWLLSHSKDRKFTFLYGPHDAHYVFKHRWFRCAGYNEETQRKVDTYLAEVDFTDWKLWTKAGDYLVSHAGFCPNTQRLITPDAHKQALENARKDGFHPLWMPGECRGGPVGATGGPLWLDWDKEFKPILDLQERPINQIVAHTEHADGKVHMRGKNYSMNCQFKYVLWVDGDKVTIQSVTVKGAA